MKNSLLVLVVLVAALDAFTSPSQAVAAPAQCDGRDATIEVTDPASGTVTGTEGPDVIVVDAGVDWSADVRALGGDDVVCLVTGVGFVDGGTGDDILLGNPQGSSFYDNDGDDVVRAGGGDDTVLGALGSDVLRLGPGDDQLLGGDGDADVRGGPGDDTLIGGTGDDTLRGNAGDDWLIGAIGDDDVTGGPGDDIVVEGEGDDVSTGGAGRDGWRLIDVPDPVEEGCPDVEGLGEVAVDLRSRTSAGVLGEDSFAEFETYHGGYGVNTWIGSAKADRIDTFECGRSVVHGAGGDDVITVSSRSSQAYGDEGDDLLIGTDEAIELRGGPGRDRLRVADSVWDEDVTHVDLHGGPGRDRMAWGGFTAGDITLDLAARTVTRGDEVLARLWSVQDAVGGPGDDVVRGDALPNQLWGGAGDDTVIGRGGRDRADGAAGTDRCVAEVRARCES